MQNTLKKIGHVLLKIFIIITSPIWFFWKILFVRKPEKKFKNVSMPKKVFRIVRAPITLPLKFICFMFIISLEIVVIYKVRYSYVTYPLTRSAVYNYYTKGVTKIDSLMGIKPVYAVDINDHKEEFKKAFSYIDKWDLDSKNKMYVALDAEVTKLSFKFIDDKTTSYILNKFNTDEVFRENMHNIVKNINSLIRRFIREYPEQVPFDDFDFIINSVASVGSLSVDYRQVLDIAGSILKFMIKEYNVEITEMEIPEEDINIMIDAATTYSKGKSIKETYDYLNEKYPGSYTQNNTTIESTVIYPN